MNGTALSMLEVSINSGMEIEDSTIIVPSTGTYLIGFSINNAEVAVPGDNVAIANNGTIIEASRRPITISTNTSAIVVSILNKGDRITLVPSIAANRTLTGSGAPSSQLMLILISY